MAKFIKQLFLFLFVAYVIGEIIVRTYKLNIDVPDFYQDTTGLLRNKPNQTGSNGDGTMWVIGQYGEYGYEPKSLDNLITVIGDSYIKGTMNPPQCHQAYLLSQGCNKYNYYPCARAGASFIEFMEMTKSLNRLHPVKQLLYVHHADFIESITEVMNVPLTVQLSVTTNKIRHARLTKSRVKDVLYNFKFAYFLYRNYFVSSVDIGTNNRDAMPATIDYDKIQQLLTFVKMNYQTENIVLVLSPDTDKKLIELVKENNFHTLELTTDNYKLWQFEHDSHWSCHGHEEAAKQVSKYLE